MRILVTGGAGFIGSNIVDGLIADGNELAVLDNLSTGDKKNINKKAKFYKADLAYEDGIRKVFKKFNPEFVIHCAAQTDVRLSMEDPHYDASQNILNSINLFQIMKEFDVRRIIYLSSGGAIYEDSYKKSCEWSKIFPKSPYGLSKHTVEEYLRFYNFNYKILRLANVYGPRNKNGVIRLFTDKIREGKFVTINGGKQIRDFVHVSDVVEAVRTVSNYIGIYNVGTGIETSITALKQMIYKANNIEVNILDQNKRYIKGEAMYSCLNGEKLEFLGWKPKISLVEGLTLID